MDTRKLLAVPIKGCVICTRIPPPWTLDSHPCPLLIPLSNPPAISAYFFFFFIFVCQFTTPIYHTMSDAKSRLSGLLGHFVGSQSAPKINFHTLSPTFFLPRAASIEPDVSIHLVRLFGLLTEANGYRQRLFTTSPEMAGCFAGRMLRLRTGHVDSRTGLNSMATRELGFCVLIHRLSWSLSSVLQLRELSTLVRCT